MRNIKGPKSALTDFIEEYGIKIKYKKDSHQENNNLETPEKIKKPKKIKHSKPLEIVNQLSIELREEHQIIKNYLEFPNNYKPDDGFLEQVAAYLSKHRMMSRFYFDFLIEKSVEKLYIFDCSNIKDSWYNNFKNLARLELCQCGQLTEATLNSILKSMSNLKSLKITGAYLIENFNVPITIENLDVTNCSRLRNDFIIGLNKSFKSLKELRLSYCYGFSPDVRLSIDLDHLYICETKLSEFFFQDLQHLKSLSVKMCPNINYLPNLSNICYLDVEGITTLNNITLPNTINHLNIAYALGFWKFDYENIFHLNLSHCKLETSDFQKIYQCKKLEYLNISWNPGVNDDIIENLTKLSNLKKIEVFGCFALTKESARVAYIIKARCEILGNPSETEYLLND